MAHMPPGYIKMVGYSKAKPSAPTQSITMMAGVGLVLRIIMDAGLTTINASDVSYIQLRAPIWRPASWNASNSFAIGGSAPLSQLYRVVRPSMIRTGTHCSNIGESAPSWLKKKRSQWQPLLIELVGTVEILHFCSVRMASRVCWL